MDPSMSAFSMYQKQGLKKRKITSPKPHDLPSKKFKKNKEKQQNAAIKSVTGVASKKNKSLLTKKSNSKTKTVIQKNKIKHVNGSYESDEEIPTLVPIDEDLLDTNIGIDKTQSNVPNLFKMSRKIKAGGIFSNKAEHQPFNPISYGLAMFKWLIYPVSPQEFLEQYWEKDVLHIERNNPNYYHYIFSSDKLDNILREYPLHFTRNVDVVTYENGKKEVHNEIGRAVASQLWDYYSNGCSIRVLNPQTYDQNVHAIISNLQEYFGTMVGTNVYLTPPGSQGFAPHFDDIEAFVIQLEGCKHWKLYKPKNEDVLARESSPNFNTKDLGDPFMEVELRAGDLLYFPRGTIHEGHTKEDAHSLHITVSVYQHTSYVDLLEHALPEALKKAANENVEFRKGLPLNYLKHVGQVNRNEKSKRRAFILNKVKSLMGSLIEHIDVDSAADQLGRRFMYDAMPPLCAKEEASNSVKYDGDYMKNGRVFNRIEITPDIKIRLLRYYSLRVVLESPTSSKIFYCTDNAKSYHGEDEQFLEIDNTLLPGLEILQQTYPDFLEVDRLPIDDESAKIQLVSDLWERGLLVTEAPLPSVSSDVEGDDSDSESSDKLPG